MISSKPFPKTMRCTFDGYVSLRVRMSAPGVGTVTKKGGGFEIGYYSNGWGMDYFEDDYESHELRYVYNKGVEKIYSQNNNDALNETFLVKGD